MHSEQLSSQTEQVCCEGLLWWSHKGNKISICELPIYIWEHDYPENGNFKMLPLHHYVPWGSSTHISIRLGVLTWLARASLHRLTPGSGAYRIKGLDLQLVFGPLLQTLQGDLPLQPVVHQSCAGLTPQVRSQHSDPVAHALRVSIVLGLWQWLRGNITLVISQENYWQRCSFK